LLFEAQILILRNKSEVVLHQQSGDFSEQSVLHRVEKRLLRNFYLSALVSINRK
jgi:hypothetical protein